MEVDRLGEGEGGGMKIPEDIKLQARSSARTLLGRGYIDDYYDNAASDFIWLYQAGYEQAIRDERAKQHRKKTAAGMARERVEA